MPNPVNWFEIVGHDPIKLQKFYGDVFGWKLSPPMPEMGNYSMLDNDNHGINGGIGGTMGGPARVSIYMEVDDVQAYLDKAVRAGGAQTMPPTPIPGGPTIGMFTDPEGNNIGLMKNG